jgi:hypothetical protein
MDFYAFSAHLIIKIAQQHPGVWYKLVETIPCARDIEDRHIDAIKDSYRQIIKEQRPNWFDLHYYLNSRIHRDGDLPAIISSVGQKYWMKNGRFYRDGDLPVIEDNGYHHWFDQLGRRHRDGGLPAIVRPTSRGWYKNGEHYRDGNLPHEEYDDGRKFWWGTAEDGEDVIYAYPPSSSGEKH